MTTAQTLMALKSVVCLLLLWFFVFLLWKDYCMDAFRERIFTLRNELFLVAARGEIGFDDPAYKMLRERLNVSLRYAHEYTLTKLLLALAIPSIGNSEGLTWAENTKALPRETRELLDQYRNMFVLNVLRYMILRSYFLAVLLVISRLCAGVIDGFSDLTKRYILSKTVEGVERLESEALEEDFRHHDHTVPVGA